MQEKLVSVLVFVLVKNLSHPVPPKSLYEHEHDHDHDPALTAARRASRTAAMSDQDLEAFRNELRSWLADNIPDELRMEHAAQLPEAERLRRLRAWQAKLAAARWVGITWPVEYGGRAASIPQQIAYTEEMARAEAPQVVGV